MSKIKELQKLHKLTDSAIRNICAQEHMLKKVYLKKDLKKVNIDFKDDTLKIVRKIAKALKVSTDAVIGGLLHEVAINKK